MSVFIYAICDNHFEKCCVGEVAGKDQDWIFNRIDDKGAYFKKHCYCTLRVVTDEDDFFEDLLDDMAEFIPPTGKQF